ncbi:MAG: nucleoside deaminase [Pseudomonas sp.]
MTDSFADSAACASVIITSDEQGVRLAMQVAMEARRHGELPFGAVLADASGKLVLTERDRVAELNDRTQHAETRLVKTACAQYGPDLSGFTLYTTCEPCAMCFTTAWLARVSRMVCGTNMQAVYQLSGGRHREMPVTASAMNQAGGGSMELLEGVLAEECLGLFDGVDFPEEVAS